MWFRNLQIFRLHGFPFDGSLQPALEQNALLPCGTDQALSIGWVPPRTAGDYVHEVNCQWLIALGVEKRLLPASVVRQRAQERQQTIESEQGRRVGRREFRELQDEAFKTLLPQAFIRRYRTFAWIDPVNDWLVIDAASPARADELIEQLHKTGCPLQIQPVKVVQSPVSAMTGWLADGEAPAGFTIDQDTELQSAERATVRYAKHALDGDDIPEHIAAGKVATRLGITWADKISFVLTDTLRIKRLAFLDILKEAAEGQVENEDERFDSDFALMTGELAKMLTDLVEALGGEMKKEA